MTIRVFCNSPKLCTAYIVLSRSLWYNVFNMDFSAFTTSPVFAIWIFLFKSILWWYPLLIVYLLWVVYVAYIRAKWIKSRTHFLLEIKVPKEVSKSPKAMEVVLSQLHQPTEGSLIEQYVQGRVRSWFTLEMASFGGDVHFYIRCEAKYRQLVESQVYSQYPGVEVTEAEDYAYKVPYGLPNTDWNFFGLEFKLTKPDAYPIKTYVDYGLDKDPKEEFKIDPLTSVLEYLGSLGPGEQSWVQIGIMAARKRYHKPGSLFGTQSWQDAGKEEVKKILGDDKPKKPDEKRSFGAFALSPGEREKLEAVERGMMKYGFEVGYRVFYLARKDNFIGTQIGRMMNSTKQYGSENLNGFKFGIWTDFDYPWQDFMGWRLARRKREMFENYRRRAFFWPPVHNTPIFVLNTEELATIYHFPGLVATTPTLGRIMSKRGEPPVNLPV